jgi:hypothetical protein
MRAKRRKLPIKEIETPRNGGEESDIFFKT